MDQSAGKLFRFSHMQAWSNQGIPKICKIIPIRYSQEFWVVVANEYTNHWDIYNMKLEAKNKVK